MAGIISVGKMRCLQQCATARGAMAVLALDHRQNLRAALHPTAPDSTTAAEMTEFKRQVIGSVGQEATAVLLDPQVGAAQCIISGALPGKTALISAVEETGYVGDPTARKMALLTNWSVAKAQRMGANAVKLLIYYHPDAPTAGEIEDLVRKLVDDCARVELPLFLEPLSYSPDPAVKKLSPKERRRVVIETAHRMTALGVDILKAEFPVDIQAESDERVWAEACAELSGASKAPWVLLSASAGYETFLRMVTVACQQGASGVAVGRAVWQEAPPLSGEARRQFLDDVARPRMARITALCDALARPWSDFYTAPQVDENWYQRY
jgi:tagatose 1,6-diphosphate aldolase